MAKKNKRNEEDGLVYSTNNQLSFDASEQEETNDIAPEEQNLRIHLDRLGGGKLLTRVSGMIASMEEMEKLGKELKQKCGVGGNVKNNEILIQGDHRDKILLLLQKMSFKVKKAGG